VLVCIAVKDLELRDKQLSSQIELEELTIDRLTHRLLLNIPL
jgi:hypothetical protein